MSRNIFFWGLLAGVFSALASIIYDRIHEFSTTANFSKVVNIPTLVAINIGACLLAALGYALFTQWMKKGEVIFNFVFSILSFASIIIPISATLPLNVQYPELFPGLTVPMHFFPAIAWYTLRPIFIKR